MANDPFPVISHGLDFGAFGLLCHCVFSFGEVGPIAT